jgi:hypothetical protein
MEIERSCRKVIIASYSVREVDPDVAEAWMLCVSAAGPASPMKLRNVGYGKHFPSRVKWGF